MRYNRSSSSSVPKVGRRKGFAIRLHGEHWLCVHISYIWMKHCGLSTPEVDALIPTLPDASDASLRQRGTKSVRMRGEQVKALVELLRFAGSLPFGNMAHTLNRRAIKFAQIDTLDLIADSAR